MRPFQPSIALISAAVALLSLLSPAAHAQASSAPPFVMAGAWGNFFFPPTLIGGEVGTQINLETIDLPKLRGQVFVEKALHATLAGTINTPSAAIPDSLNTVPVDHPSETTTGDSSPGSSSEASSPIVLLSSPVDHIQVEGSLSIDPENISALTTPYEHRALSLVEIQTLGQALSKWVQDHKHQPCNVYVGLQPDTPQTAPVLVYKLVPLSVGKLTIGDGKYFKARAIRRQLGIKENQAINLDRLERTIRQIQSNPDLKLETTLEPVEYSNDVNVSINIADSRPYHLINFFNNYNLNVFGQHFLGSVFVHNNITGSGDSLLVSPIFSRKGQGVISRYEYPLNNRGTRLFMEYSFVHAKPEGKAYDGFGEFGNLHVFTPGISQILYDKKNTRVMADLAFNFKNSVAYSHSTAIEREQIRDIRFGVQWDRDDAHGNTATRHEFGVGIPLFGASLNRAPLLSNPNGGSQFFRYTGSVVRTQSLPWGSEGIVQAVYNVTSNSMNSFDQWGPGGAFLGRGYRESFVGGDTGVLVTAEWHVPCFFIPKRWKLPGSEETLRNSIKLVAFADYTQTHLNNQAAGVEKDFVFVGTGLGIRANLNKYLTGRIDFAMPLVRQLTFNQTPRIHFGLQSALF